MHYLSLKIIEIISLDNTITNNININLNILYSYQLIDLIYQLNKIFVIR